jgi:hypothetical protein
VWGAIYREYGTAGSAATAAAVPRP